MIIPIFKRIFKTDYQQEYQNLVEQLSYTINNGFEVLYDLANKKISLKDNIFCSIKEFDVTVAADGTPLSTLGINLTQVGNVEGVTVLSAINTTNPSAYVQGGIHVSFTPSNTSIQINNIKGLIPGNNYRIKLVIFQF